MSQSATAVRILLFSALAPSLVWAQNASVSNQFSSPSLAWHRVGQPSINRRLAGAASGPVSAVWYSSDSRALIVQTSTGAEFQTTDFENWTRTAAARSETPRTASASRVPEGSARTIYVPGDPRRLWALGQNLYMSEDSGASWTNVTAAGNRSIVGSGQNDVAVDPDDPSTFAVANSDGVWATHDAGRSWTGLNDKLPNLPVAKIVSTARGNVQVALNDGRTLQLSNPRAPWEEIETASLGSTGVRDRQRAIAQLGADITAFAESGDYAYAGSSDGRIWASLDQGKTWGAPQTAGRSQVVSIFVDPDAPRAALASLSGASNAGGVHIARTVNGGAVWDDVTANLTEISINAVTGDLASGTAFAATDQGVYTAHLDLNSFTAVSGWTPVSGPLPKARAVDIALDTTGRQVFVALEGYGLYSAPAGLRPGALRVANAADFSNRAAAPGSVISVLGGQVSSARVGDLNFPILAAKVDESQLQVPFEAPASSLSLSIQSKSGGASLPLSVHSVSPAIFIDRDGSPFLVDADTGLAVDPTIAMQPQTRLQLMVTGLGRVQPPWQSGVPAPAENPPAVVANVQAFLNSQPLEVTKATLAPGYVGYYLVEVQLPAILDAGTAQLSLVVDGQQSNRVNVLVAAQ